LRRMAEYFHEFRQRVTEVGALDITPSFSKGVATVITLQIDQAAPFFNQVMKIRNGQAPSLADEKVVVVLIVSRSQ